MAAPAFPRIVLSFWSVAREEGYAQRTYSTVAPKPQSIDLKNNEVRHAGRAQYVDRESGLQIDRNCTHCVHWDRPDVVSGRKGFF
jgi:hypothetical protein